MLIHDRKELEREDEKGVAMALPLLLPSLSFSAASSPSPLPPPSYPSNVRSALSHHIASFLSLSLKKNLVFGPTLSDGAGSYSQRERRLIMIPCASSQADGRNSKEFEVAPSDESDEDVPLINLPLESKLQLKLEQKLKMKLAKKIRLRRKKLLQKRGMRKKGRWPPSKMNKLKNV